MLKIPKSLAVGGLVVYFLYLVVSSTPATLLSWGVMKAVPQLSVAGVTGTLWNGKAAGVRLNLDGNPPLSLGPLSWRLSPWNLALFKACLDIKNEKINGGLCRGVTGASQINNLQLELPAALAGLFVRESGASVDGDLSLMIERASLKSNLDIGELKGNLSWRGAKVSVNGMAFALGDFAADLKADGAGGLKAQVSDLSGPIKVNLEAGYKIGQSPKVSGEINPSEQAPAAIRDALSLFATQAENGAFKVVYPLGG
jgi:general secretion pathway protein N